MYKNIGAQDITNLLHWQVKQKQPTIETPNDSRDNISLQTPTTQQQKTQYVQIISISESSSTDDSEKEGMVIPNNLPHH